MDEFKYIDLDVDDEKRKRIITNIVKNAKKKSVWVKIRSRFRVSWLGYIWFKIKLKKLYK